MKPEEFYIGLEFFCGPFAYRCTDVGTRTVTAIRLVEEDPFWYQGPPYLVDEIVLDEARLSDCYLTELGRIEASLMDIDAPSHPGYSVAALHRMMEAKHLGPRYPRSGLLRFDRVRSDGEILHPYSAHQDDGKWHICVFAPFTQAWLEVPEKIFAVLPIASSEAIGARGRRPTTLSPDGTCL